MRMLIIIKNRLLLLAGSKRLGSKVGWEAIANILKKAQIKNKIAGIIFELTFQDTSFRLYSSGKAIFRSIKNREELNKILSALLL